MIERRRRVMIVLAIALAVAGGVTLSNIHNGYFGSQKMPAVAQPQQQVANTPAITELGKLAVKDWASHAGYSRTQFGNGWQDTGACDMRNRVLQRDLADAQTKSDTDCTVESGTLQDPYTGKTIHFTRGQGTSTAVQIDHVVALSNAWQTGAQLLDKATRQQLANDPLELLAVDGPANQQKK